MYQTLAQGEVLGRVVCDEGEGHDRDLSVQQHEQVKTLRQRKERGKQLCTSGSIFEARKSKVKVQSVIIGAMKQQQALVLLIESKWYPGKL